MFKSTSFVAILLLSVAFLNAQNGSASSEDPESAAASDEEYVETLYQPVKADSSEAVTMFQAADQSLFVLPTAYMMPAGKSALTDFELFILQYTYAAHDRIHLSLGMVFPIYSELLQSTTLGGKVNYYRGKTVQCALYGSITPFVENSPPVYNIGNVVSLGTPANSVHFVLTKPFGEVEDLGKGGVVAAIGGITNLSRRVAGIGELYFFLSDDSPIQVISLGLRFKGENISWDLGGIRPLGMDVGKFIAVPFIKATFLF